METKTREERGRIKRGDSPNATRCLLYPQRPSRRARQRGPADGTATYGGNWSVDAVPETVLEPTPVHEATIGIIGAGTRVGRAAVSALADRGIRPRVLVGRSSTAMEFAAAGVDAAQWSRKNLQALLEAATRVLVVPPNGPKQLAFERGVYDVAADAGTDLVVKVSTAKANVASACPFFRAHAEAERLLQRSGLGWKIMRCNSFMQNLLWFVNEVKQRGTISLPFGRATAAPIDLRDVGAALATVLVSGSHEGGFVSLTGPEQYAFKEIAGLLSQVCGRSVRYEDISRARFADNLTQFGLSNWWADAIAAGWWEASRSKVVVANDFERLLGYAPRTLGRFLEDYRWSFVEPIQPSVVIP